MWAAASALAGYITRESGFRLLRGRRVVELGAGLGLCGFVAAQYAAYTAITVGRCRLAAARRTAAGSLTLSPQDGDDFTMDLLRQNAESNGFASRDDVSVDKLRWGADEARAFVASHGGRPFDVVAGSDIIYAPESVPPLLDAVAALLAEDGTFLLAYEPRNVWMATVIDAAAARGLHVHCNLRDSIYHFRRGAPPAEGGAE